jgi:hypothetical protein
VTEKKSRFDEVATEIIAPIMEKLFEVAFDCMETYKPDSEIPVVIPIGVKEGVLEKLDEVIEHCHEQAGHYDAASLIGFALGKDGAKPGRKYRGMEKVATALRDLISARNDQIEAEFHGEREHHERERMAAALGF